MANRDDTIVIYSSTESLIKYIEILQEIKREHPELISRTKEPPVLTGKIDGWIGYGSEPEKTPDGQRHSFNEIRAKVLESSIDKLMKQWIMNHRNKQITYQGKKLSFQDYIAMKSTEKLIANLERRFLYLEENDKKVAKKNGTVYTPSTVIDRLGYTLEDVRSSQFKQNIYRVLKSHMDTALPKLCNGSRDDVDKIEINVKNGKQITFGGYDLETVIQKLAVNISKNDSNFIKSVQTEIKNNAKQYGIDSEKFCFDTKAREKIRTITEPQETPNQQQVQQVEPKNKQQQEYKVATSKPIDMSSLDVQSLPQMINSTLMERKMKLPNGDETSAKKYIQEIVYPQLPKSGIVILDNGAVVPVKQFIEECVMSECQEKYNGDFLRYMAERTRNNLGVVSIENGDEKFEINPVEITEFINPDLLEKRVKLPNGIEVSARQYIQEIYAPHIPANGRVILSNGVEISVKQYIEEELLLEGQEKYNGDISQILYNTTRNNTGIITANPQKLQENLIEMRKQIDSLNNQHSNIRRR